MSTTASTAVSTIAPTQELLVSLQSDEFARQEEEQKQNPIFIDIPLLRRERPEDYNTPPRLVRQDTLVLPPPTLIRERPEDYLFDTNSFISPDRINIIQMPRTPVAERTLERDLSFIRPRRLNFN